MCLIIYLDKASIEKIMGRVADSTIKGFMYQFNLTLNQIMGALDDIIKVKGIVEYIDMTILQRYNVNIMRNSGCC